MKKTDVQKAKTAIKEAHNLVQHFTGLSSVNLSDLFFHTAYDWALQFVGSNDEDARYLREQPMFWAFWVTEWTKLQQEFVNRLQLDENGEWYFPRGTVKIHIKEGIALEYIKFMQHWMLRNKANSVVLELAFHKKMKQEVTKK